MTKKLGELTYKEIFEQSSAFEGVNDNFDNNAAEIKKAFEEFKPEEIIFTGCGTSLYLAQTSAAVFSYYNNIRAIAVPCSELFFFPEIYIKDKKVLVVPITRRSDTTEVRMAINKVREFKNVATLAITCDENSRDYNDYVVLSPNAKEKSVVMTKSFSSMVYLNVMMALVVAKKEELLNKLMEMPSVCKNLMNTFHDTAKRIIEENKNLNLYITVGQGVLYGIANECMNKIKEMAIANSEAYYSLEYRHGPMALADSNTLITLLASDMTGDHEIKLIKQLKGYGAKIFVIADKLSDNIVEIADYSIELGCGMNDFQLAPLAVIPSQFLGYYAATSKGLDADYPRNLSQAIIL